VDADLSIDVHEELFYNVMIIISDYIMRIYRLIHACYLISKFKSDEMNLWMCTDLGNDLSRLFISFWPKSGACLKFSGSDQNLNHFPRKRSKIPKLYSLFKKAGLSD
jgi:hypothetical protein